MHTSMFGSIRKYSGAPTMVEELLKKQEDIKTALKPVAGFQSYYLLRTNDGAISLTLCDNRAGAEESNRVAATWLKDKLPVFASRAPEITTGEVQMHLNGPVPVKVTV